MELDTKKCRACWRCVAACRKGALGKVSVLWHKHAKLRRSVLCVGCGRCAAVCQTGAIKRAVAP